MPPSSRWHPNQPSSRSRPFHSKSACLWLPSKHSGPQCPELNHIQRCTYMYKCLLGSGEDLRLDKVHDLVHCHLNHLFPRHVCAVQVRSLPWNLGSISRTPFQSHSFWPKATLHHAMLHPSHLPSTMAHHLPHLEWRIQVLEVHGLL